MPHSGKIAIVTGGSGALGSVVTRFFLDAGAKVAIPLASQTPESVSSKLEASEAERVILRSANLTEEQQVIEFTDHVVKTWGRIDYLVNIAGGYIGGKKTAETSLGEWQTALNMNLTSMFLMSRAVLPVMQRQNYGRIVSISAMTALTPSAGKGAYGVAKRGVVTLTETIAEEYKEFGITANAIAPSIIVTPANKAWMKRGDESRWVTPEEIASTILFLCSDEARSLSGTTVKMYGRV